MKGNLLFENFDLLAEAPNSVERLRDLILRLALNGNFSPSNSNGWQEQTVREIATEITPGFACGKQNEMKDGYVHLRTHNISTDGKLNFDKIVRLDPELMDPKKSSLRQGDILFNNTNSQELVGKTCLVDRDYNYGFSNHLTLIRVKKEIFSPFLVYFMNRLWRKGHFAQICTRWINQAAVNTKALSAIVVNYPAYDEQRRIVAKVDQLMALCDELEEKQKKRNEARISLNSSALDHLLAAKDPKEFDTHWQRISSNFDLLYDKPETVGKLRQAILQLAVQGKLSEPGLAGLKDSQDENEKKQSWKSNNQENDGSDDEPASVLLEKIKAEKERLIREKKIKPSKPLPPIAEDEVPYELPKGWVWCRLGEVQVFVNGYAFQSSAYQSEGIGIVRIGDIQDGRIVTSDMKYVDKALLKEIEERFQVKPGDMLIAMSGATTGKIGFNKTKETFLLNQRVGKLHFIKVDPVFASYHLNTKVQENLSISSGSAIPNLSTEQINMMVFPLAPEREQKRIVARVDLLMTVCDELETNLTHAEKASEELVEAVVREVVA